MTSLETARADLAAALEATDYPALATVPEQIEPPCLILQPAENYVSTEDTTFDQDDWLVTVDIFAIADYRSNEQAANTLDTMLGQVLPAIAAAGWAFVSAGAPGPYNTADWVAHGIRLTVNRNVTLTP